MAYCDERQVPTAGANPGLAALAGMVVLFLSTAAAAQTARVIDPAYAEAWLATIREDGRQLGLAKPAERVFRTSSGRYYVPDEKDRAAILALRSDRSIAAALNDAFALRVETMFAERIGRAPTRRDRAALAALGPTEGARLIKLVEAAPDQTAATQLPDAARLHRRLFYDGFRERSAREVWAAIVSETPLVTAAKLPRPRVPKSIVAESKTLGLRKGEHDEAATSNLAARANTRAQ